jgi:tRNA1(Val) A37 N6-methylase TrmN6
MVKHRPRGRYPLLRVDGYDCDPASADLARRNIAAAGLADRVRIYRADITTVPDHGPHNLVTAFECPHDLPQYDRFMGS